MSTPLKFMVASERQAGTKAALRSHSSLDVELILRRRDAIGRPVDLALALKGFGLRLRDAHRALDRIVADEEVSLMFGAADPAAIIARLYELGVSARQR